MAEYLVKWPSGREPISKIGPSDGCGRDAVLLAGERWYDFHGFGCHLENVGSNLALGAYVVDLLIDGGTRKADALMRVAPLIGLTTGKLDARRNNIRRGKANKQSVHAYRRIREKHAGYRDPIRLAEELMKILQ